VADALRVYTPAGTPVTVNIPLDIVVTFVDPTKTVAPEITFRNVNPKCT
jgi:hypothetical protein